MKSVSVVIPTRNRPEKLHKCLTALALAQSPRNFDVFVCDSTPAPDVRNQIIEICNRFSFVRLRFHDGNNVATARNFCAQSANTELIINVDDDVYVEPDAIRRLINTYEIQAGHHRVVAGSVRWGDIWSEPVVMRPIGYGRAAKHDEAPDFLLGAFFIYSRQLALAKPWNEAIRTSDDRFMGALWRASSVKLSFEPNARAIHDAEHVTYGIEHQTSHIYVNLFDAIIANPQPMRALCYEILGFIWGMKATLRLGEKLGKFFVAWGKGHRAFVRDYKYLTRLASAQLPPPDDCY